MPQPSMHVVILAAGDGTRMLSRLPKVLHTVAGRPMVGHVIEAARRLNPASIVVVVPAEHDRHRSALDGYPVELAVQDPPSGTGDAAQVGLRASGARGDNDLVLVINGDCPGLRSETLEAIAAEQASGDATGAVFLSGLVAHVNGESATSPYGRMVRDTDGTLLRIVEAADCDAEQLAIPEVNGGIYLFVSGVLERALQELRPDNSQGELYLTDTLEVIRNQGGRVGLCRHHDLAEIDGVNTRAELARAEELLRSRKAEELMLAGVTLRDPSSTSVDVDVEVGADTILYPGVVLEAGTSVGEDCVLYPNVRVARSRIGSNVTMYDGTVIEDAVVEDGATLGPYARLRPEAHICEDARVGNFVEIKKSRLGRGSKANHLTYLGDAEIGAGVNIGAGTITCNYDGANKHTTVLEDGVFVGSNTAIVAPVRVGRGATIGAGSTITKDVPADGLAVARSRQVIKEDWTSKHSPKAKKVREAD